MVRAQDATGSRWRLTRSLLVAYFLCRGLIYLGVMPPFEGWDEYQHVAYVIHVRETGRPPTLGKANVSPALLGELVHFPQPRSVVAHQLGRFGVVDYATYWRFGAARQPRPDAGEIGLYEAQHGWGYYRLVAPLFTGLGGLTNLSRAVGGLRLLNLAFMAAAIWVILTLLPHLVPSQRNALLIGLVITSHPLFLINGLRVANDALGVLLATIVVVLCFRIPENPGLWLGWCGFLGLFAGLAIAIKAVNFGLLPLLAAAWLFSAIRLRISPIGSAAGGAVLGLVLLLVLQGEFRENLSQYGVLTAMQEAIHNRRQGRSSADLIRTAMTFRWDVRVSRLWLRNTFLVGGWSRLMPNPMWSAAYAWAVALGLMGALGAAAGFLRGKEPRLFSRRCFVYCTLITLSFTGALAYHMVQSKLAWGEPTTCPWYAGPALPWFLWLVAAGGLSWPYAWARLLIPLGLTGLCVVAEQDMIWNQMIPTYSGGVSGLEALHRLARLQPPILGSTTVLMAESALILLLGTLLALLAASARRRDHSA